MSQHGGHARRPGAGLVAASLWLTMAVLGGCGIPEDTAPRAIAGTVAPTAVAPTPTPEPAQGTRTARIYLLDANGRLAEVEREVTDPRITITTLLQELIADPTAEEAARSLTTAVPSGVTFAQTAQIQDRVAILDLEPQGGLELLAGNELSQALAQIVWTLAQTENIDKVQILIDGAVETWVTPDGGEQSVLEPDHFRSFDPDYVAPTPTAQPSPTSGGG